MIYVIRHGQTNWNFEGRMQGQSDIPLNEAGRAEAAFAAERLSSYQIDLIISSDLGRAVKTAQIINRTLNKPMIQDRRLREVNYGTIEGKLKSKISEEEWHIFNEEPSKINAESFEDVYKRVKSFFNDFSKQENILVVTHGGLIRMMLYFEQHQFEFDTLTYDQKYKHLKIKNMDLFCIEV